MRCPGQDRRYWTEDAVFEVPCPECGAPVEFFKDESKGRCGSCGHKFPNPGIDFGCAKWCSLAEQCLGFIPEDALGSAGAKGGALAGRLIGEVKTAFEADPARIARSLKVYYHAKELVAKEGGEPRIVLAAALLLEVGRTNLSTPGAGAADGLTKAKDILGQIGADDDTVERVGALLVACLESTDLDSAELSVIADAAALTDFSEEASAGDAAKLEPSIDGRFKTHTAREKARSLLRPAPGEPNGKQ